jgi:hypothetical protein
VSLSLRPPIQQKVLIALWADETPFKFHMHGPDHRENGSVWRYAVGAAMFGQSGICPVSRPYATNQTDCLRPTPDVATGPADVRTGSKCEVEQILRKVC